MDKLRLKFSKTGRAAYISHLDLMRTMQRSFSRAGVGLKYSEGFNPHAKISIILPLTVGTQSVCEYMDFALVDDWNLEQLPAILNASMPEGIEALEAYEASRKGSELRWLRVAGRLSGEHDAAFYNSFFKQSQILVKHRSKKGERTDDIIPSIKSAVFTDTPDGIAADLILHSLEPTLSPDTMMAALGENAPSYFAFTRMEAFCEDMTPFR